MAIVEVGFELSGNLMNYNLMLEKHGWKLFFACRTHDVYYTNLDSFNGMTENQIKRACKRIRVSHSLNKDYDIDRLINAAEEEQKLLDQGYHKVFDTIKFDFQYAKAGKQGYIQLQDIQDIGLVIYYDDPDLYELDDEEQRLGLIQELIDCGFDVSEETLGIDKLRTLYYGKKLYSKNQNS